MKISAVWNETVLVCAVAYGLLSILATYVPFIGFALSIVILLSLLRYGYAVLLYFAQGHGNIPAPDFETANPFGRLSFLIHYVAFPAAMACATIYLPAGQLFSLVIAAVFPASAALMAVTGRIESALSPTSVWRCIAILGRDYLYLLLVPVAVVLVGNLVDTGAGNALTSWLGSVVSAWAVLAMFALIGTALHAHRLDFDIPGERVDPLERERQRREHDWQEILDRAYAALRGGKPDAGYRELRAFLAANAATPDAHYWLVERLFDWEDKQHALGVAARLIDAELGQERPVQELELYRRCRRASADFVLAGASATCLAEFARSIGHSGVTSELEQMAASGPGRSGVTEVGYNRRPGETT